MKTSYAKEKKLLLYRKFAKTCKSLLTNTAKGIPLFYWVGARDNEFEFVVENNGKILPVDVKKSGGKLNSLTSFRQFNPKSTAIKISANNYGYNVENDVLTIPLYETFLFADDIAKGKTII